MKLSYNKIIIAAVLAVASSGKSEAAPGDSIVVDSAYSFNAIDHLMQRPAVMPKFEKKKFLDRFFISAEGGMTWMRSTPDGFRDWSSGYRAGLLFGDWMTPVHGWRVGLNAGRHTGANGNNPVFVGGSLDYLMNLSALMRGDDYSRKFDVIGVAGVELQGLHLPGKKYIAAGARIGLQARWYATPSTFFFVEPRMGVYSDNIDDVKTWHHYDLQPSVMLGLGYRITRTGVWSRSIDNSEFVGDRFSDNLFAGVGATVAGFTNNPKNIRDQASWFCGGFIGKWFAAHSGLRLQFNGGKINDKNAANRWAAIFDLDYLANINSIVNGYDSDRKFETNVALGLSLMAVRTTKKEFCQGVHAGLQGVWNVSRNVGIYVEPHVRVFNSKIMGQNLSRRYISMPSLSVGLIYRNRPSRQRDLSELLRQEREDFEKANKYYMSASAGIFGRTTGWVPAFMSTVSFGSWFTPQVGWRFNLGADNYEAKNNPFRSVYVGADLMTSLSTLALGYDPSRVFDLRAFAGLTAGMARYRDRGGILHKMIYGPEVGLHAAFRVSKNFELFVEPMAQLLKIPQYRHSLNPQWRIAAGITYRLGRDENQVRDAEANKTRDFVFAGFGSGIYSETMFTGRMPIAFEFGAGRWLNGMSGVQLTGKFLNVNNGIHQQDISALTLDYLLNISSIFNDGMHMERFNILGILGAGVGWSNNEGSHMGLAGKVGLQARWSVSKHIDITLTPAVTGWTKGVMGQYAAHRVSASGTLTAGLVYNF